MDQDRAEVVKTDLFASLKGPFHYIFANPPYISKDRINTVDSDVLDHEPHDALFAEDEGLLYVNALLDKAHNHLVPGGKMYIEFDSWQKELIESNLSDMSYTYSAVEFWNDIYDRPRVITVTKPLEKSS